MGGTLKIFLGVLLRSRETVKIYGYRAAARILSAQPPPNKFEGATLLIFPALKCNHRIGNAVSYFISSFDFQLILF
jgi:hypothetical protein